MVNKSRLHTKHQNQVRISSGALRGRKIQFATAQGLRPTPEIVREKLFNWLGQDLTGQKVLDLFSGSGIMAFEAASRNAQKIYLCDTHPQTIANIQAHINTLSLGEKMNVQQIDALSFLAQTHEKFHLVLLDPPFVWQEWATLFSALQPCLKSGALIYIEAGKLPEIPEWLSLYRQGKAGQSQFALLHYLDC